ncbi:hypothetical protein [Streptomyces sp. NPDC056660]|uniref:hypothetical protein n=1 Tax=Streptomyces sp. NPDC056660 TaxID=3345897 RepID=UPI00367AA964
MRELYSRGDKTVWTPAAPYFEAIAEDLQDSGLACSALRSDPLNAARWRDLPCGPAVSCITWSLRRSGGDPADRVLPRS